MQVDSLVTVASEAGKAIGTWGGAGVLLASPLLAQLAAWKKFPWPKKLRWAAAFGVGLAGGAGILHEPRTGIILAGLGGFGWTAIKATWEWWRAGHKWMD